MHRQRRFLLIVAGWLLSATFGRADNLDAALMTHAKEIRDYLRTHHFQNVGVLKFRVQKGEARPSWQVGPLNANLASRLENALILVTDESKPPGIIHDADKVARARRLPSYASDAGMEKLFQQQFPLASGNQAVKADAFLTGLVQIGANLKQAAVTVQAFAPHASRLETVVKFTVPVDRELLNDLGESFALSTQSVKSRKTRALDIEAAEDAANRDQSPGEPSVQPAEKLLEFEIRYDGQPQTLSSSPTEGGKWTVAEPQEGQRVTVFLRTVANERIGVVLMINGKNSLYEEEAEPAACKKWILDPGDVIEVKGFQVDENNTKPFRVLSATGSEAVTFTDNLGLMGIYVFRSGKPKPAEEAEKNIAREEGRSSAEQPMKFGRSTSLRNPAPQAQARTRSLKDRKALLAAQVPALGKKRGVVQADDNQEEYKVQTVTFPNPEQQQAWVIRYYHPKAR